MNTKELKDQLWEVWFKAREAGASRIATNAIIDAMIVIDKEAEKSEKTEVCSWHWPIIYYNGKHKGDKNYDVTVTGQGEKPSRNG